MSLDDIVNVSITKQTVFPSKKGFGTPMIVASHSYWLDRVRMFQQLTELTDAGVATSHPIYKMATKILSNNPRVKQFVVGRRALAPQQVFELTIKDATEGKVYAWDIVGNDGTVTSYTYTVLAAATTSTVATAIAALIDAHADIVAAAVGPVITATTGAGKVVSYENLPLLAMMGVTETTADPGIATDLAAIETAVIASGGNISFYGMCFDVLGEQTINAIATFTEARKIVSVVRSSDHLIADVGTTTDVASDLKNAAYARTALIFSQYATNDYRDAAWLGNGLSFEPGEATWAFKTLPGVTRDRLTSGEETAIKNKRATVYVQTNSINYTFEGLTGSGDYIDTTIGLDWLHARIQEAVFGLKTSAKKIPYTQKGVDAVVASVQGVLNRGTREPNTILKDNPAPVASAPPVEEIDDADKATRTLPDLVFTGELQGAIHKTVIRGTVTL